MSSLRPTITGAELDMLIEEATVDCYNEEEQITGLFTMIEEHLVLPFDTSVLGMTVTVTRVDLTVSDQIVAICRRDGVKQAIPILDLLMPAPAPDGAEWIEHTAAGSADRTSPPVAVQNLRHACRRDPWCARSISQDVEMDVSSTCGLHREWALFALDADVTTCSTSPTVSTSTPSGSGAVPPINRSAGAAEADAGTHRRGRSHQRQVFGCCHGRCHSHPAAITMRHNRPKAPAHAGAFSCTWVDSTQTPRRPSRWFSASPIGGFCPALRSPAIRRPGLRGRPRRDSAGEQYRRRSSTSSSRRPRRFACATSTPGLRGS